MSVTVSNIHVNGWFAPQLQHRLRDVAPTAHGVG